MTTGDLDHTKFKQEKERLLTHLDEHGNIQIVDVTERPEITREAIARGRIRMAPETVRTVYSPE